jgi:hypothetical protein
MQITVMTHHEGHSVIKTKGGIDMLRVRHQTGRESGDVDLLVGKSVVDLHVHDELNTKRRNDCSPFS